jgi:hypothetical protein
MSVFERARGNHSKKGKLGNPVEGERDSGGKLNAIPL